MPEPISAGHIAAKNSLARTSTEVFLFEVDLDGVNAFRVCDGDAAFSYAGSTFSPVPMAVEGLETDSDATLPNVTVTIGNLSPEIASRIEAGGILDRVVRIYQANTSDATFVLDRGRFVIQAATLTATAASFSLSVTGLYDVSAPVRRQARGRCDNVYGDSECGYLTTLPNMISATYPDFDPATCDLGRDSANGCTVHGLNEVANGRPKLHPLWFGAHPGIPKGPARL